MRLGWLGHCLLPTGVRYLPVAALLALASCREKATGPLELFPTKGEVYVRGQPAVGAIVGFHPQGPIATDDWPQGFPRAVVDGRGEFWVGTYGERDGCPAGSYVVVVTWPPESTPGAGSDEEAETPDRLQGRYATLESSPLTATVEAKPNQLKRFDLN